MLCCFEAPKLGRIKKTARYRGEYIQEVWRQDNQEFKVTFDYKREFEAGLGYARP